MSETPEKSIDELQAKVVKAFAEAVKSNKEEDSIKMAMVQAGCAFKQVAKLYNDFMIESGFISSKEERSKILERSLQDKDVSKEDTLNKVIQLIVKSLKGTNDKSAASMIRAWCKKNEVECYHKPKSEGTGRSGFASKYYEWLLKNPQISAEAAKNFINGKGNNDDTSENVKRHESHYLGIHELVVAASSNTNTKMAA